MTIGVVTVAVGEKYQAMLPRWVGAVAELNTQPDEVCIVVDTIPSRLAHEIQDMLPSLSIMISNRPWRYHPQILANDGIGMMFTNWICKMDVDDLLLPHAFDHVEETPCDVYCFGISHRGRNLYGQSPTAEQVLTREANYVFSGSPFRRALWVGNEYRDMIFEDWAFWVGCAKRGAIFQSSRSIDYVYSEHEGQISQGVNEAYWASVVRSL